jgi:hypothetical protein
LRSFANLGTLKTLNGNKQVSTTGGLERVHPPGTQGAKPQGAAQGEGLTHEREQHVSTKRHGVVAISTWGGITLLVLLGALFALTLLSAFVAPDAFSAIWSPGTSSSFCLSSGEEAGECAVVSISNQTNLRVSESGSSANLIEVFSSGILTGVAAASAVLAEGATNKRARR